jgi:hypothetical protein
MQPVNVRRPLREMSFEKTNVKAIDDFTRRLEGLCSAGKVEQPGPSKFLIEPDWIERDYFFPV